MGWSAPKKTKETAGEAFRQAQSLQQELILLRNQLRDNRLLTEAVWGLLRDKLQLDDAQLQDAVNRLHDQKIQKRKTAAMCPNCNRPLQEHNTICIYCGHECGKNALF